MRFVREGRSLQRAPEGRQCWRLAFALLVAVAAALLHVSVHCLLPYSCHSLRHCRKVAWLAEPGRPDAVLGHFLLYCRVFRSCAGPAFWLRRPYLELLMAALVAAASTLYHALQAQSSWGPPSSVALRACVLDALLTAALAWLLAPDRRSRALPAMACATGCFVLPGLLSGGLAVAAYSWLQSAWHLCSALLACRAVGFCLARRRTCTA